MRPGAYKCDDREDQKKCVYHSAEISAVSQHGHGSESDDEGVRQIV